MKRILLAGLALLTISAGDDTKPIPHISQPLDLGDDFWFGEGGGELDDSALKNWDYVIRVVEMPSFRTPIVTDHFARAGLFRYHVRRLIGKSADVDLVLESKFDSQDKPKLQEWSLKLPESGGTQGFDGSTFIVKILAPGIKRTIRRWSPDASDKDPLEADLAAYIERNTKWIGVLPRSTMLKTLEK